jgi:hypothetical protein
LSGPSFERRGFDPHGRSKAAAIIAFVARSHIRASMRFEPPVWVGRLDHGTDHREIRTRTRRACMSRLRRLAGPNATLWVEVIPDLVGVSEAATILGWDRRRVSTYVSRGAFPEPVAALASGRVWRREDVEAFGRDRARRRGRRIAR